MHTIDPTTPEPTTNPVSFRIIRAALPIIPTTAIATATIGAAATELLDLDTGFAGLDPATIAATSAVSLVAGALVLAALERFVQRPYERFVRLTIAFAAISLIGPFTVLWTEPPDGPAHSGPATALTLALLHVATGAAAIAIARRAHRPPTASNARSAS